MNFPLKPPQASEQAISYDLLFNTIVGLTVFFTLVVGLLVTVLAIRYRRGSKVDRTNPITHHKGLEILWLTVPLLLGLSIFAWSSYLFVQRRKPPADALELYVVGKQWMWHVQHMNGIRENNEMHVPLGKPIKLTMISQDVIHAMYLPDFRTQYHVVPGRYTQLWFTPIKPGKYKMLCAMHCGTQHSEMVGSVYVMPPQAFNEWLANEGNRYRPVAQNMIEAGRQIFTEKRCDSCHGAQTTERGPSLNNLFGSKVEFEDGSSAEADEDYLREAILNPYQKLVKGYSNTMPSYEGGLSEEQVLKLIAYIKSNSASAPANTSNTSGNDATKPGYSAPAGAIDIANENSSAGVAQSKQSEARP